MSFLGLSLNAAVASVANTVARNNARVNACAVITNAIPPPPPPQPFRALKHKLFASIVVASLALVPSAKATDIGFEFGAGFSTGGDWSDTIDKAYGGDSSGLGMFVNLQGGVPIGITENAVVKPKLALLLGLVSVDFGRGETESHADTIVIPGVAGEYYLNGYKDDPSVFAGIELGLVTASGGDGNYYDLSGDGLSFGFYGGYAFGGGAKFSIGYRSIPVEVKYLGVYEESANFGGVSFLFNYAFS
ncbi:MAG: hypothetical protein LBN32_00890 [Helicobacteraceae bacterium]|jgi:hypothetical protein|nr:hypothetical protein [Helicobacteraceae bacterium]